MATATSADKTNSTASIPEAALGEQLQLVFVELRAIRDLLESKRKPTLTVDEVARLVGRDPYTVRAWIKRGRLRAIRVKGTGPRGRLLIDRSELDHLLAEGRGSSLTDVDMS